MSHYDSTCINELIGFVFVVGGYRLIYDRMCPMTQVVIDEEMIEKIGHPVESFEKLQVKILVMVSITA